MLLISALAEVSVGWSCGSGSRGGAVAEVSVGVGVAEVSVGMDSS